MSRQQILRGLLQLVALSVGIVFFARVWPGMPWGFKGRLVSPATPLFAWLPPFLVYLWRNEARRVWRALIGSIALVVAYGGIFPLLERLERMRFEAERAACLKAHPLACVLDFNIDPAPPPQYWEWTVIGYFVGLVALYAGLERWRRRRRSSCSDQPSDKHGY